MEPVGKGERFDQAISGLCARLRGILEMTPRPVKESAFEVRLRIGKQIVITGSGCCWFLDAGARLHNVPQAGFTVTKEDIEQSVIGMCSYSLHSHQDELRQGFITLRGGHRAGICGTAVTSDGKVTGVRDITSINLRIARDIRGAAAPIVERVLRGGPRGLLISGPPSSGKTTVLRDLARQISNGLAGGYRKVAVVDERGEIGAVCDGQPQNDLGPCCDILSGYPKAEAILTAIRTLSPQVVMCDEIGGEEEVNGLIGCINCGVHIIATAHASSLSELARRVQIRRLLEHGAFEYIIQLGCADKPGEILEIAEAGDLLAENGGGGFGYALLLGDRAADGREPFGKGGGDRRQHNPSGAPFRQA